MVKQRMHVELATGKDLTEVKSVWGEILEQAREIAETALRQEKEVEAREQASEPTTFEAAK